MESIESTNRFCFGVCPLPFPLVTGRFSLFLNMPMVTEIQGEAGRRGAVTRTTAAGESRRVRVRAVEARVRSSPEPDATEVRVRLRADRPTLPQLSAIEITPYLEIRTSSGREVARMRCWGRYAQHNNVLFRVTPFPSPRVPSALSSRAWTRPWFPRRARPPPTRHPP